LELHLEGDGSQYPRLFVPLQDEIKRDAVPYLLLAKAMNLLREEANPRTGAKSLLFVAKDESGFDTEPIDLGKDLPEALVKIDMESADFIHGHVDQLLNRDFASDTQRMELQKLIVGEVERIKSARGNNVNDEMYRRFLDGGKQAVKVLKREA
jgi:hypothetical protein